MATNPDSRPLPDGWVQQFNNEHQAWFYVNTKAPGGPASQWTHPADDQPTYAPPPGNPPSKTSTPFAPADDKSRGASEPYYQSSTPQPSGLQQTPYQPASQSASPGPQSQQEKKRGIGGFFSKLSGNNKPSGYQQSYSQAYPQQQQYGAYPQQQYGYAQQPMYQQQPMYAQRPQRAGMGAGGAAALGLGGGLLGGMLIGDMISDSQHDAYMDGYQDGEMGDMGGGDFGGDF
ncbi:hypothetical protein I312_104360 [Cryptococcus bacillisporus CA1280]|uniref:Unplaced genomic scaffold supercont1.10, whole genome shotgun sequence n=1 Tax=Cryptococcus bacillisporus CA1280 TaxID=1296109 RepID=A0A0D0VHG4_CRYGA|nr:hypothetical protein I312_03762 [Cryptococcus bacillisporus CA1280]